MFVGERYVPTPTGAGEELTRPVGRASPLLEEVPLSTVATDEPTALPKTMNRRDFLMAAGLAGLGTMVPERLQAVGQASKVTVGQLDHGSNVPTRSSAIRRLLQEVDKRTSIDVDSNYPTVTPTDTALFDNPMAAMLGDEKFDPLAMEAIERLRTYLTGGGFLVVDSAEGVLDGPFMSSIERMFGRMFPDKDLEAVPSDHVLYKSFYLIDDPVGRLDISDDLMAIFGDGRLYAVVSQNDLFGALARDNFGNWEYEVRPGDDRQREMAFRLGINLVMYALCVNYKSDQVHVPFILKRRKWKVD
jgi:hypothetical protein